MDRYFSAFASRISHLAGQPAAFMLALLSIAIWGMTGPLFGFSDTWQLVVNTSTTIVTFLMVFVIQNAQNRDAAALQAKLDEVIRSIEQCTQPVHRHRASGGSRGRGDPPGDRRGLHEGEWRPGPPRQRRAAFAADVTDKL